MSNNDKNLFDPNMAPLPYFESEDDFYDEDAFVEFATRREAIAARLKDYWTNCKIMMASSLSHFRAPSTIIVIFLLIALYILLGVAGTVNFSVYTQKVVQDITIGLDIIVNALLGFYYGPVLCCISVTLCCVVKMITSGQGVFIGYIIGSAVAGFLHGWILYKNKVEWFGSRFRGFYTDLIVKSFMVRLVVSAFVNILLMAVIYKIFINYPIYDFIMHYSKSGVELTSYSSFLTVFVVGVFFETAVIFLTLAIVDFIVMRAFPSLSEAPSLVIGEDGELINLEEEMLIGAVPVAEEEMLSGAEPEEGMNNRNI